MNINLIIKNLCCYFFRFFSFSSIFFFIFVMAYFFPTSQFLCKQNIILFWWLSILHQYHCHCNHHHNHHYQHRKWLEVYRWIDGNCSNNYIRLGLSFSNQILLFSKFRLNFELDIKIRNSIWNRLVVSRMLP